MASNSTAVGVSRDLLSDRQRASVTPTASIPRIQFSSGSARALQQFGADMFSASQRIEGQLDQQAQAEGTVEGATAGLSPEFELRDYTTIRARAFNQAGIQTFVSTLETSSITATAEIRRRFSNDPSGMQAALQQYNNGVAQQIDQISPGAGASYRQRAAVRAQPAIEAARDSAFRLTRDQADAMLIASQTALQAELKVNAADLFSDNPARSQAASSAVGMVGAELMRVFDAVDPVTGRPLFSASERAAAQADFKSTVFKTATVSWFDAQEDQVAAYLQFISGDFKIDLDMTGPDFDKMPGDVAVAISTAATKHNVDPDALATVAWLESKFNANAKNPHSSAGGLFQQLDANAAEFGVDDRFDAAQSADGAAAFMADNKDALTQVLGREPSIGELYLAHQQGMAGAANLLSNPDALAVDVVGSDQVTLNGGSSTMTAQEFANKWIRKAEGVAEKQSFDVSTALSPGDLRALETEMRSQINFKNQQSDRANRLEAAAHEAEQEGTYFDMSMRLVAGGEDIAGVTVPNLTREAIVLKELNGELKPAHARALLDAMSKENATQSDLIVYDEALRRIADGEDATTFILNNQDRLSKTHAAQLIADNRKSLDDPDDSTMTQAQRDAFTAISRTIAPEGFLPDYDTGIRVRAFEGQKEFRLRISEGEDANAVATDIINRSRFISNSIASGEISRTLKPRFFVPGQRRNFIDVDASFESLDAAFDAKLLTETSYLRQLSLIERWEGLQADAIDTDDAAQTAARGRN